MKRLFLKDDGRPRLLGWIVLLLVTLIPPKMLSDALEASQWVDLGIFLVWFVVVSYVARRALGMRV